jgi:hypothetical protein
MITLILAAAVQMTPQLQPLGTGAVCGHVDASSADIAARQHELTPTNIVVARSTNEAVSAPVNLDGSFCFAHLLPDLHTITAFGDTPAEYQTNVMVVAGKTTYVEVHDTAGQ